MVNAITISHAARSAGVGEASEGFNPTPTNAEWLKVAVARAGFSIAERAL